jgi:hypothetical protein
MEKKWDEPWLVNLYIDTLLQQLDIYQWFSTRVDFSLHRTLAMSGDIFGCHIQGKVTGI